MSGAEAVAGLVLGVLPLLVAAAEHYEDVFRPFARYRKFAQEVQIFQKQFKTQKTIFRNECRLLLTTLTDRDVANQMLEERCHPFWTDRNMDETFARQLGHSGDACAATIALIQDRLKDIDREGEGFCNIISTSHKPESLGVQEWRRRVGKKLKFSFSASRLDECMAHLRNLNGDFATLSSQIVRMGEGNTTTRTSHRRSIETDGKISEFQAIRIASQQVYNALGKACTIHTRHSAQLCLEAKRATSNRTQVRLDMAFTHLALSGSAMLGDPMWFAIESITNDLRASDPATMHRSSPDKALSELTKTLKRPEEVSSIPCKVKKLKFTKSVRFAVSESSTDPVVAPDQSSSTPSLTQEHPLPDLCVRSNFCMQMRKCSDQYRRDTDVCIGILEKTSSCEHLVYLPPLADTRCVKEGVSLTQLISSMTRKNLGEMLPQYERLRLAKSLAVAILQFQATPWLAGPWRSQDVLFFDLDNSNSLRGLALTTPYLNVPIASQQSGQPMHPSTIAAKSCLAPNPLLYSFGVVLLELAYEAPLQSLQQPCDLEGGQESRYAEFFAARRLSKTLGSMLGSTYAQIVRKCLTCDFGCGDDLRDQTLQAEFYRDVVCELERLEGGFRKLQLGT